MASNLRPSLLRLKHLTGQVSRRNMGKVSPSLSAVATAAEPAQERLTIPQPDGEPKVYSQKIEKIYESISKLNLLEVAELSDLLKKRLNLPDAPVMNFGAMAVGAPAARAEESPSQDEPKSSVQTSFTVKLMKFDDSKKIALIKELKNLLPDVNLVQAKKIIESAPTVLLKDCGKDEADKMKDTLSKFGAEIIVE